MSVFNNYSPRASMLGHFFLLIGLTLIGISTIVTLLYVKSAMVAREAPIEWVSPLQSDKGSYKPGQLIVFTAQRKAIFGADEEKLLLVAFDGFRNIATDETYPGAMMGRVLHRNDSDEQIMMISIARTLPDKMTTGTYILEGWMSAATSRRTMPTTYESTPFKVESW